MTHRTTEGFWERFNRLPADVRHLAIENYELLRINPKHPSLHLKMVGSRWSVRVGLRHRALGIRSDEVIVWFWIGTHAEYDKLIGR